VRFDFALQSSSRRRYDDIVSFRDDVGAAQWRIEQLERSIEATQKRNLLLRRAILRKRLTRAAIAGAGFALGVICALVVTWAVFAVRPAPAPTPAVVASVAPAPVVTAPPVDAAVRRTWTPIPGFEKVSAVALTSGADFAVGPAGAIWRHGANKSEWTREESVTDKDLLSIAEINGRFFAVGKGGVTLHLDDKQSTKWVRLRSPTQRDLYTVRWSVGMIAVGEKGTIVNLDDDSAEPMKSPTHADLFGVCGGYDVRYIVGAGGTIMRETNGAWELEPSPTKEDLYAVWCDDEEGFAVGAHGTILHKAGRRDPWAIEPSGTTVSLRTVAREVAGGDGPTLLDGRNGSWTPRDASGIVGDVRAWGGGHVLTQSGLFHDEESMTVAMPALP
jgi:hypothetical protein